MSKVTGVILVLSLSLGLAACSTTIQTPDDAMVTMPLFHHAYLVKGNRVYERYGDQGDWVLVENPGDLAALIRAEKLEEREHALTASK